jgi:protein-tyrosine-phosphatase/DNA-binding HxlR family transcriptional regulator
MRAKSIDATTRRRAAVHAVLAEPVRLAIVEDLRGSDRSVSELSRRFRLPGNLLAHHLDALESVGFIERVVSTGDGRRRYVRLLAHEVDGVGVGSPARAATDALFVCSHNSARSQLAAALWRDRTGRRASSAGTRPAPNVHPGAVAAARRAGLDLGRARPRPLEPSMLDASLVVTVCDRAHEELEPERDWLHWSVPDPVLSGRARDFDAARDLLDRRIAGLVTATESQRKERP